MTGVGDVIEAEDDAIAIGSGGNYALASAKTSLALCKEHGLPLTAKDIAVRALEMASSLCIYTNGNFTIEEIRG
jgi:ATP-dependent HslUV protease subunit HslV